MTYVSSEKCCYLKRGEVKRGVHAGIEPVRLLNPIGEPKFKVMQRAVQDRYSVLEKAFKSKRNEDEKASN